MASMLTDIMHSSMSKPELVLAPPLWRQGLVCLTPPPHPTQPLLVTSCLLVDSLRGRVGWLAPGPEGRPSAAATSFSAGGWGGLTSSICSILISLLSSPLQLSPSLHFLPFIPVSFFLSPCFPFVLSSLFIDALSSLLLSSSSFSSLMVAFLL